VKKKPRLAPSDRQNVATRLMERREKTETGRGVGKQDYKGFIVREGYCCGKTYEVNLGWYSARHIPERSGENKGGLEVRDSNTAGSG